MGAAANIPVIDISSPDQTRVAKELVEAAVDHGFIYIKNTGGEIPLEQIDDIFDTTKALFALPVEEKAPCKITTTNAGWVGMHTETLDPKHQRVGDYKEAWNFREFLDGKAQQPLPPSMPLLEPSIGAFRDICHKLSLKLLTLLGIGLDIDPHDFFTSAHFIEKGSSGTTLRLLYYPPLGSTDAQGSDMRAGAHSDYGSITLLFRLRGQAGLEIQTGPGSWAPVPVCPLGTESDPAPPILVNIGDLLSYWTNGLFRSTVHRVVFPSQGAELEGESSTGPRYSIAYFVHPVGSVGLTPVPSERVRSHVPSEAGDGADANPYAERKVLTADEHLQMRLRASYLGLYKEDTA